MITLVIRYRGNEKTFCFTKRTITFGPKSSSAVDIPLPIDNLEAPHVEIIEHNGRYTVHNLADDPDASYNGLPFGRRTLAAGAVLKFHDVEAIVHKIDDMVQEAADPAAAQSISDDLSLLMKEVDSLDITEEEPEENPMPAKSGTRFFWAGMSAAAVFLLAGAAVLTLYLSSQAKSDEEELKAARGLSDAAMALFYAKNHNIRPPNRNWSDPNFLEQILGQIIPRSASACCDIDSQGNFADFPYILRVYTNDDASRFLLLAQPKPSFIRWFRPKDSLAVDSSKMELRKIKDIQPLNRIIFNSTELNSATMKRIALLVSEGQLIPIEKLDKSAPDAQFKPPEELKIVAPGAQNLVYNAPRYYKITEPLLIEALEEDITNDYLQDLNAMIATSNLVFYTTEGVKTAVRAYKNLNGYIDSERLLVGYFTYDSETHLPGRTELLVMSRQADTENHLALAAERPSIALHSELRKKMMQLGIERKKALKPIGVKIYGLIQNNNENPNKNFKEQLTAFLQHYRETDIEQQKKISQSLSKLYQEYVAGRKKMTRKQFIESLKSSRLLAYLKKPSPRKKAQRPYNPLMQAAGRIRMPDGALAPGRALR